jgi:hypothetical protein
MINEVKEEKPVEVTLPDDPITEIELSDKKATIKEETPVVRTKEDKEPSVDQRERALLDLKKQYEHQKRVAEAEREARKQAEYYAQQQAQQVGYAHNQVQDSNLKIILNAIDATEQSAANAEFEYAQAMAAGNHALAAKAQRAIAQAEAHLLQLQNGRQRLEETLQDPTEGAVYAPPVPNFEPQIPQDPVEMYAAQLAPRSAQWLREHPEAVNKIGKLTRAHQDAVEDGLTPETDDYFDFIESRLGYDTEPQVATRRLEPAPQINRRALASAPVSSAASVSSRSSGNGNTMVLSSDEVEMAVLAEPELPRDKAIESYARNKAFLIKQGKLSA